MKLTRLTCQKTQRLQNKPSKMACLQRMLLYINFMQHPDFEQYQKKYQQLNLDTCTKRPVNLPKSVSLWVLDKQIFDTEELM